MKFLIGLAVAVVSIYGAYKLAYPTYTHRYLLTVELEIDGEAKRGSTVIEVKAWTQPKLLPQFANVLFRSNGEGILFPLKERGALIVLLLAGPGPSFSAQSIGTLAIDAFDLGKPPRTMEQFLALQNVQGTKELAPSMVPQMVALRDIGDPRSAYWIPLSRWPELLEGRAKLLGAEIEMHPRKAEDRSKIPLSRQISWLGDAEARQQFWDAIVASGIHLGGTETSYLFTR